MLIIVAIITIIFIVSAITHLLIETHKANSLRFISDEVIRFRFENWLNVCAERAVRIVEEGGLPQEFQAPANSEEKFQLACNILQDAMSFAGFDVKQFNIPALIKSKINEVYHGELKKKDN